MPPLPPLLPSFIARDNIPRNRFCYWNGPARDLLRRFRSGAVYLPAPWAGICTRGITP